MTLTQSDTRLVETDRFQKGDIPNMSEVTVYRTWEESMASMALDLLHAEGIHARRVSVMPRSVYPVSVDGLGEIEIVVSEDEAQEALDILAVRFSEGEPGFAEESGATLPVQEDEDSEEFETDPEEGADVADDEEEPLFGFDADEDEP